MFPKSTSISAGRMVIKNHLLTNTGNYLGKIFFSLTQTLWRKKGETIKEPLMIFIKRAKWRQKHHPRACHVEGTFLT